MDIHILMIDDEKKVTDAATQIINGQEINGNRINLACTNDFEEGKKLLTEHNYDILILDIFKGKPSVSNPERPGEEILGEIKKTCFIPVVFFSGLTKNVEHLKSDIIRVVTKTAGGNEKLLDELKYLVATKLPFIKRKLDLHIKECMREYFWDFVQNDWKELSKIKDEISLGYLLMRRLAKSFSKENIAKILEDRKISGEKIYPMEFYIYPPSNQEPETGGIIKKNGDFYIIITPTCEIVNKKTEMIRLAECIPLKKTKEYQDYQKNKIKYINELRKLIESRKSDRYFFLPKTHFIDNLVIDFQRIKSIALSELKNYEYVAKLDDPFSQSMIGYFIRYYNRIGTEDIDWKYILKDLD